MILPIMPSLRVVKSDSVMIFPGNFELIAQSDQAIFEQALKSPELGTSPANHPRRGPPLFSLHLSHAAHTYRPHPATISNSAARRPRSTCIPLSLPGRVSALIAEPQPHRVLPVPGSETRRRRCAGF